MLVTETADTDEGLKDVRYLFEACHLDCKNDAAGHSRSGTSFDDGYGSSSSRDDDSDPTGLVAGLTAICIESIDDTDVLRRGPTRTKENRPRPQPYGHQQEFYDERWSGTHTAFPSLPPSPPKPSSASAARSVGDVGRRQWTLGSPLSHPSPEEPLSVDSNASSPPLEVFALGCSPGSVDQRDALSSFVLSSSNDLSRDGQRADLMADVQIGQELVDDLEALLLAEPALPEPGEPGGVDSIKRYLMDEAPLVPVLPELDIEDVLSVLPAVPTSKEPTTQSPVAPPQVEGRKPLMEVTQTVQANLRRYPPILPKDSNTSTCADKSVPAPASCQRQSRVERDALRVGLDVLTLNKATMHVRELRRTGKLRDTSPNGRSTFIHHAVLSRNRALLLRLVESLIKQPEEGLHIDVKNAAGYTALHLACLTGQPILVGFLCEAGARTDVGCLNQQRPLHLAAELGDLSCVSKLLQAAEPGLDAQDYKGRTALHLAVLAHKCFKDGPNGTEVIDCIPVIRELISHNACVLIQDVVGETVLHYAVAHKKIDVVEVLMDYSPNTRPLLGITNRSGRTALHVACSLEVDEPLQVELVRQLVLNRACPKARDTQGLMPGDLLPPQRTQVHRWLSTTVTS